MLQLIFVPEKDHSDSYAQISSLLSATVFSESTLNASQEVEGKKPTSFCQICNATYHWEKLFLIPAADHAATMP